MKRVFKLVDAARHRVVKINNYFLLTIIYMVGVGWTSLLAKVIAKKFIPLNKFRDSKTSFTKHALSTDLGKMY